jgi:hypothetical protein
MAVTVSLRGNTKVKRVVVGKPIRRINTTTGNINNLGGVDTSAVTDGAVLIYNGSSGNFEATTELNNQEVNGGQY